MPASSGSMHLRTLGATSQGSPAFHCLVLARASPQVRPHWSQCLPHKIFVWDLKGVYQEYSFLNPLYGHFIEPTSLIGATTRDVLSRANSHKLRQAIAGAWKFQALHPTTLTFHRNRCTYQAAVQCIPTGHEQVMGIVIDAPLKGNVPITTDVTRSPAFWQQSCDRHLTPREKSVLAGLGLQAVTRLIKTSHGPDKPETHYVRAGLTNKELAEHLGLSVRTVKEHVTNIYHKLQIVSRHHRPPH